MITRYNGYVRTKKQSPGFTLVELLLVVVMLGLIAAIALPKFSNASSLARANTLRDNIRTLRMQLAVFRAHHLAAAPGYPGGDDTAAPTEAAFIAHLTLASKEDCTTAAIGTAGYDFGPYFSEIPANPVNGKSTVQMVANSGTFPTEADNSHGYVYQPSTLQFRADTMGVDEDGTSYFAY